MDLEHRRMMDRRRQRLHRARTRRRPTWDEFFGEMAKLARRRSTCYGPSGGGQYGAVIVKKKWLGWWLVPSVVSIGYNGGMSGEPHCIEVGCDVMPDPEPKYEGDVTCRRTYDHHAERNAVDLAGEDVTDCTIFVTGKPSCARCTRYLNAHGIFDIRVV